MAQVTRPLAKIKMVETNTIHPPHCRCGTNSRISTRNASNVINKVGSSRISKAVRKRGECDGACKCVVAANIKQISVSKAAIGCTMSIAARECRALEERVKLSLFPVPVSVSILVLSRKRASKAKSDDLGSDGEKAV